MSTDIDFAECLHENISNKTGTGRVTSFGTISGLPVPDEIALPTCAKCGHWFQDRASAALLDEVLGQAYVDDLGLKARVALTVLTEGEHGLRQRDIEPVVGLSAGYLSKVRNAKTEPSAQLTALLMLLAVDKSRLQELRDLWPHHAESALRREPLCRISSQVPVHAYPSARVENAATVRPARAADSLAVVIQVDSQMLATG